MVSLATFDELLRFIYDWITSVYPNHDQLYPVVRRKYM